MRASTFILGVAATLFSKFGRVSTNRYTVVTSPAPTFANPIVASDNVATPTSPIHALQASEETCLPAWAKCQLHNDCCSCYCAFSVLWGFICGGNAWTSCRTDTLARATAGLGLEGNKVNMPDVTNAPTAPLTKEGTVVTGVVSSAATGADEIVSSGF